MLRAMVINPVILILAAAAGLVACRIAGVDPHVRAMLMAAGVCGIASEVSVLPFALNVDPSAAAVFQQSFLGTVLHLALCAAAGVAVVFLAAPGAAFVYWLLAMYWVTLIGLCSVFIGALRKTSKPAPTATN